MEKSNKVSASSRRQFMKLAALGSALVVAPTLLGCATGSEPLIDPENEPTPGPNEDFLLACERGNLTLVEALLAADDSLLNATDVVGRSGFALALLAGHKAVAEALKTYGYTPDLHELALSLDWDGFEANVGEENAQTIDRINSDHPVGGTALWAAAAGGAGTKVWRVYGYCGDPNINPRKEKGTTPVQKALRYPNLSVAELTVAAMVSNDADVNPAPNADMPPLHIAAERGSYAIVELLIRLGADVNYTNQWGRTALQVAEYHGQEAVAELLRNSTSIPLTCRTSRMAYTKDGSIYVPDEMIGIEPYEQVNVVGVSHSKIDALKAALSSDPRLAHSIAKTSERAVEAGAHMGRPDIVELLLDNGAPYSLPTAVMMNDFTTVKKLLDEDAQRIYERGAHDFPLLWFPVLGGGNVEMMELLLKRGAEVEEQHFLGTTALHWACFRGPLELIELLVENGADVNRIGRKFADFGESPLQSTNDEAIINYLKSKGAR